MRWRLEVDGRRVKPRRGETVLEALMRWVLEQESPAVAIGSLEDLRRAVFAGGAGASLGVAGAWAFVLEMEDGSRRRVSVR